MSVSCPKCGSRFLRLAHPRSHHEWFGHLFGKHPLRCQDCRTRFIARTFIWSDLLFAKCPCCRRMDLNSWNRDHWRVRGWTAILLSFGALRLRCEYCRVNFVSFRQRKEHFTFSRWTRRQAMRERDLK